MNEVIETTGAYVQDKSENRFRIDELITWFEKPENQARFEDWKQEFESQFRAGLQHADHMVAGSANIMRECLEGDQETIDELTDGLLDSFFGRK